MTDELHKLRRRLATERWRRHRAERREATWRYVLDHAPQYQAQRDRARGLAIVFGVLFALACVLLACAPKAF